jgi:hypothetical protein
MYFVFIYDNRRMKPVEIVLRRRGGKKERMMEGINVTMIYCKFICRYQNESTCIAIMC